MVDDARGPAFAADLSACQNVARQKPLLNDAACEDALIGAGIGVLVALVADDPAEALAAAATIG